MIGIFVIEAQAMSPGKGGATDGASLEYLQDAKGKKFYKITTLDGKENIFITPQDMENKARELEMVENPKLEPSRRKVYCCTCDKNTKVRWGEMAWGKLQATVQAWPKCLRETGSPNVSCRRGPCGN